MRRFYIQLKTVLLVLLILLPFLGVTKLVDEVQAKQGSAKVYILQLSDIGAHGVYDPSQVREGAIEATTPTGKYKNMPRAHPKYGQTAPFYSTSYQMIFHWSLLIDVIRYEVGAIVVNTHGEILPVPSAYTKEDWVDLIADAMTQRRLTWTHIAGYPFYYVWFQGDSEKTTWGVNGFKALMSHIGLGNVELWAPESGLVATVTGQASQYLFSDSSGWFKLHDYANKVALRRPLKKSDFADCITLPIYSRTHDSEVYWEGAIIAFAKSGTRYDPEETEGFGSFVHLGTDQTYDSSGNPTDRDYSRGYVATAAAIWAEALDFKPYNAFNSNYNPSLPRDSSLNVAPIITGYWWEGETMNVRIVLGIYGALAALQSDGAHTVENVGVTLEKVPDDCLMQAKLHISRNGEETGIKLEGLWEENELYRQLGLLTNTALYILPLVVPALAPWVLVADGVVLFSQWTLRLNQRWNDPVSGVEEPSSTVQFFYDPVRTYTYEEDYRYEEFQSFVAIDLEVPGGSRSDWRVIPVDFRVKLLTMSSVDVEVASGLSIAIWFDPSNDVMVFFEDFEEDMSEWSAGDDNDLAGDDYWGISSNIQAHSAYCAQVGTNSIYGEEPNAEIMQYDKHMEAYLIRDIDLRPYQSAELSFYLFCYIRSGDFLIVQYYADGVWVNFPGGTYSGLDWDWFTFSVPTYAQKIGFRFFSDDDGDVAWGAWIDNVQITAIIPNDASNQPPIDAGNDFNSATTIDASLYWKNYAGYLDPEYPDLQDWYRFYAESGKIIQVQLYSPSGSDFYVEIYNPNNVRIAGPGNYISAGVSWSGDWRIRIFIVNGFGQYSFIIRLYSGNGGSGCPFIYTWNGTEYVIDNNILGDSEASGGFDVEDYYRLEQPLAVRNGKYSLLIGEFEQEHSYLDQTTLLAVDHESDVNVAVSPSGEILTYKEPTPPVSAIDNNGTSQLDLIDTVDSDYYESQPGDYIILDFGNLNVGDGAKLVMWADVEFKKVECVHIQVLNETGSWEDIGVVRTRVYWATEIIDLSDYLPDASGELKVRLYFTGVHKLDYVGLDTSKQADLEVHQANLVLAIHSVEGSVKAELSAADGVYVELVPGQQVELAYTLPENSKDKRTYILHTEGHYFTIQT